MNEVNLALQSVPKYQLYSVEWYDAAPPSAGVYFVWKDSELVYVGETSSIKKRMRDLKNKLHHTITRLEGK